MRLWDTASGQRQVVIQNYAVVNCVSWKTASRGNYLVVGCMDGSVLRWQVIEKGNACRVSLSWGSLPEALVLVDVSAQDVRGLSRVNNQLLKQRGAMCEVIPW